MTAKLNFSFEAIQDISTGEKTYEYVAYSKGNIDEAVSKIEQLSNNSKLRDTLITNGLKTAKEREWSNIEKDILKLYE